MTNNDLCLAVRTKLISALGMRPSHGDATQGISSLHDSAAERLGMKVAHLSASRIRCIGVSAA